MNVTTRRRVRRISLAVIVLLTLGTAAPYGPQKACAQEDDFLEQSSADLFEQEERPRSRKSLPGDVEVFTPVQTFIFDQNPDDQLNFFYAGTAEYAGDVNGDGVNDYVRSASARDDRTGPLTADAHEQIVFDTQPTGKLGDVTGDGQHDAVFAMRNDPDHLVGRRIVSAEANGSLITTDVTYPEGEFYSRIVATANAGDLNGDGIDDLAMVNLDLDEVYQEVEMELALALAFELSSAYPNPFRDRARLRLTVRETQDVTATVYDALGRRVQTPHDDQVEANEPQDLTLRGAGLVSGTYFVRLDGEHFTATRRLTLVR